MLCQIPAADSLDRLVPLLIAVNIGLIGLSIWLNNRLYQSRKAIDCLVQRCQEADRLVQRSSQKQDNQIHQTLTVQDLYNNAPCGYHSIGVDGTVLLMNDTELEMLGYSREEVVGKKMFLDFVAPESQQTWIEKFQQLKTKGVVKEVEILLKCRNGELFPVLANSTAVMDEAGNYVMSRSTLVDVRKRKMIEVALQKSEAQYRGIVEDQTDLICRFLRDGRLTFVNQAYCVYFGMSAEELIGKPFTPLIPEDDREIIAEQFLLLSSNRTVVQYEHRVISPTGEIRWQSWSNRAIFDESGTIVEYQGVGRDISDRKLQEAALIKLRKALEIAVVGMAEVNPQGRVIHVNQAYAEMNGYDETELIGDEWWLLIVPEDRNHALRAYQAMMNTDRAEVEVCAMRKDGTTFDRKIVLVKAYDEQQKFVGHYCFTQDISSRRELDRLKDEFVSIVSHELRTPLTSIAGALDLVSSGILQTRPEQAHRMITIAAQNTERLVRMINDILDMERIKSGKIIMQRQVCDLALILQESVDVMQMMADVASVTLKLDTPIAMVSVDRDRIIQVITNLLSNAIKFSEAQTHIEIEATVLDPASSSHPVVFQLDQPAVLVAIRDRGRGIPHDKLSTIFEPFQQVDASDSRQKGGTGLGLAICRSILQQHHATLWVESTLGQGSTFYFALPRLLISSTIPV
jgi:PAS domain S-box-containing protein